MMDLITRIKQIYRVTNEEHASNGSVRLSCGRVAPREDHYTCGSEDCPCEEEEGWCDKWEEDCVDPVKDKFKTWATTHVPSGIIASCDVDEKGYFEVTFVPEPSKQTKTVPEKKREVEEPSMKEEIGPSMKEKIEPSMKRTKTCGDD